MTSGENGTIYIGVTSNLLNRVHQHKNKEIKGFTEKYNVDKLVYYEIFSDSLSAISREKHIKKWNREWKIRLIEENNPRWKDLFKDLI